MRGCASFGSQSPARQAGHPCHDSHCTEVDISEPCPIVCVLFSFVQMGVSCFSGFKNASLVWRPPAHLLVQKLSCQREHAQEPCNQPCHPLWSLQMRYRTQSAKAVSNDLHCNHAALNVVDTISVSRTIASCNSCAML